MSEESTHGATTVRASKGGGATKWLLGAAAAVVLLGGGYLALKNMPPSQTNPQTAYNDGYNAEPAHAGPLEPSHDTNAQSAAMDESAAAPAATETRSTTTRSATSVHRSTTRVAAVPEETIGVTPVNATSDSDEIVVTGARRPIWARTPSARRLAALYPESALETGREGEASLHCTVQNNGALDCVRVEETPGFGNAALRVARTFRHAPQLADGSDAAGSPVNLHVVFRIADDTRRG